MFKAEKSPAEPKYSPSGLFDLSGQFCIRASRVQGKDLVPNLDNSTALFLELYKLRIFLPLSSFLPGSILRTQ
jgi:hypothetical protein